MAEVKFQNGTFMVEPQLVGPINEVTNGSPERYSFQDAMSKIGNWQTKQLLREHQGTLMREHLRLHGTRR